MAKDWTKESPPLESSLEELVGRINVRVYEHQHPTVRDALRRRIKAVAIVNDNLTPCIDNRYVCETCGTLGQCHPITGYCFICDTDNWKHIDGEFGT